MIKISKAIDQAVGDSSQPSTDLLGDASVLDMIEDQAKSNASLPTALAADIATRTALMPGASTTTTAPGISAAVGKGGASTKKKRK